MSFMAPLVCSNRIHHMIMALLWFSVVRTLCSAPMTLSTMPDSMCSVGSRDRSKGAIGHSVGLLVSSKGPHACSARPTLRSTELHACSARLHPCSVALHAPNNSSAIAIISGTMSIIAPTSTPYAFAVSDQPRVGRRAGACASMRRAAPDDRPAEG